MYRRALLILTLVVVLLLLQSPGVRNILHKCLANCHLVNITNANPKIVDNSQPIYQSVATNIWINRWKKLTSPIKDPVLINSWKYYKKKFISDDGRVIDYQRASVTTSEGQAYAMMRALLTRDKKTFDTTYNWTKYNLQHKDDHIFAWLWGQQKPSNVQGEIKWGILDQNGATDAGAEIAIGLILASKIWNQYSYMEDAKKIINDIWNKETVEIKGERILSAGINQNKAEVVEVNPSYFMIFSFRIFAKVDKSHDWQSVVDSSYRLTNWCINHIPSRLPPDVFYIDRKTGVITFDKDKSDFSYDAIRVFYRFYADYILTKDKRATELLSKSKLFIDMWKQGEIFYTQYKQNGEPKDYDESIGSIAMLLPVIKMYDKQTAKEIYEKRIKKQYHKEGYWDDPMDYYAQNLVWFGTWLYLNEKDVQ